MDTAHEGNHGSTTPVLSTVSSGNEGSTTISSMHAHHVIPYLCSRGIHEACTPLCTVCSGGGIPVVLRTV